MNKVKKETAKKFRVRIMQTLIAAMILSSCQKQYFPPPAAVTITGTVSFSSVLVPMFTTNCAISGCHSGSVAPNLTSSQAWESLTNMAGVVDTLHPTQSILYQKIITGAMPPSGKLSPTDIAEILAWIKQGAQEN